MINTNQHQAGIAHILLVILIAAVLVAGGYAFWQVQHSASKNHATASPAASTTPSPTPSPTASATPASVATASACTTTNLSASLVLGSGAAGTSFDWLVLTNTSSSTCITAGYPGVSLLDAASYQLGQPAAHNTVNQATALVTLKTGQSAYALLGFPNPGNFSASACSATSTKLRVYPPNQTTSLLTAAQQSYCPGFSVSALSATKN